ncbi:Endonuclease/exonuclease/phosphatase [Thermothelomyces heterothallicus CBS 202.75]|uniref:Endonuclease/exonuclease/phosphatase n=1 Tax=Thermothelomyces heterothallicus CBS 202.75 TaxID=1149848 RepID=UPI003742D5BD
MGSSGTPTGSTNADAVVDLSSANPYSLHKTTHARRSEYVRPHRMRIKVGTWNVAACPGTDKDLARWFIDGEGLDPSLGSSKPPDDGGPAGRRGFDGPSRGEIPIELAERGKIGLYVLGLQEVNDLAAPSQYMSWIYAADDSMMGKWKAALEAALPPDYQLVVAEQLAGLLLLAYASPEIAPTISNVSTSSVGTGALGYLGNKGAVCTRIVLGEVTQLLFVNSHLASGVEDYYLERRVSQAQQIMNQARFEPIVISGVSEDEKTKIGDEDFAFWFGDLNFRLDRLPGDDIRRLLMLHTQGEYDLSKRELRRESSLEGEPIVVHRSSDSTDEVTDRDPNREPQDRSDDRVVDAKGTDDDSINLPDPDDFPQDPQEDPASLQATLSSLLPHDQLKRLIKERKIFHEGWREGPITFLPTYKYDVGTVALFDSSEKRRPPSWCDRILYRTRNDIEQYKRKAKEEEEARKKDEEMKARGIEEAVDDDVLFSYDPENDGEEQTNSAKDLGCDEYDDAEDGGRDQSPDPTEDDRIRLELYTSHQRITSSDHKPVSTIFTLYYDAVVPELKSKVHAEVARALDRAENEGRPGVTIVADHHDPRGGSRRGGSDSPTHVDFGEVVFLKKYTFSLTLANTSSVSAKLSFVEKPAIDDSGNDESAEVQWLTTCFVRSEVADDDTESVDLGKEVTLEPGETLNAVLEAQVTDIAHSRMLNEGQPTLEDVLVLRVTDGRDHFIPVRASWAPTCIGRSVDELIRVPDGGIRAFALSLSEQKGGRTGAIPYDLPVHRPAPKELFRLTEAIETTTQRALADAQMLDDCSVPSDPGWPFDEAACKSTDIDTRTSHIISLLDALDQDQPLPAVFAPETPALHRLESLAQTLVLFLRSLTDGVVPTPLWNRIDQAAPSIPSLANPASPPADEATLENDRTTVLDILQSAPHHNICFVFLTTTLARVVSELSPLSKADLAVLKSAEASLPKGGAGAALGGVLGGVGRRSFGFVRKAGGVGAAEAAAGGGGTPLAAALAALEKRRVRERRVAEVLGEIVCRGSAGGTSAERKLGEARRRAVVELFVRQRGRGE